MVKNLNTYLDGGSIVIEGIFHIGNIIARKIFIDHSIGTKTPGQWKYTEDINGKEFKIFYDNVHGTNYKDKVIEDIKDYIKYQSSIADKIINTK